METDRALSEAAHRCQQRIVELYGPAPVGEVGVLHGLALWKAPSGPPRVLRIDENTPRSETDRFVLHLARARADAIVTSGSILRSEPQLSHEIGHDAGMKHELDAWRREVYGHANPPLSLVLTRGANLDLAHPFFADPVGKIVYTGALCKFAFGGLYTCYFAANFSIMGKKTDNYAHVCEDIA